MPFNFPKLQEQGEVKPSQAVHQVWGQEKHFQPREVKNIYFPSHLLGKVLDDVEGGERRGGWGRTEEEEKGYKKNTGKT